MALYSPLYSSMCSCASCHAAANKCSDSHTAANRCSDSHTVASKSCSGRRRRPVVVDSDEEIEIKLGMFTRFTASLTGNIKKYFNSWRHGLSTGLSQTLTTIFDQFIRRTPKTMETDVDAHLNLNVSYTELDIDGAKFRHKLSVAPRSNPQLFRERQATVPNKNKIKLSWMKNTAIMVPKSHSCSAIKNIPQAFGGPDDAKAQFWRELPLEEWFSVPRDVWEDIMPFIWDDIPRKIWKQMPDYLLNYATEQNMPPEPSPKQVVFVQSSSITRLDEVPEEPTESIPQKEVIIQSPSDEYFAESESGAIPFGRRRRSPPGVMHARSMPAGVPDESLPRTQPTDTQQPMLELKTESNDSIVFIQPTPPSSFNENLAMQKNSPTTMKKALHPVQVQVISSDDELEELCSSDSDTSFLLDPYEVIL